MGKARRELGYSPKKQGFNDVVRWFQERGHGRRAVQRAGAAGRAVLRLALLVALALLLGLLLPLWRRGTAGLPGLAHDGANL